MRLSQSTQGFGRKTGTEGQVEKYLSLYGLWFLLLTLKRKRSTVRWRNRSWGCSSESLKVRDNKGQPRLPAASQEPLTSQEAGKLDNRVLRLRPLLCGPAVHSCFPGSSQLIYKQRPHKVRMSARAWESRVGQATG